MKRPFVVLAAIATMFAPACTMGSVQMLVPPGQLTPRAAVSDTAVPGLLRYRNAAGQPDLKKKIRAKADKLMAMHCYPARYRINAEGPATAGVAGTLSTSLPPLSMPEAIAVALDESTSAITADEYWYIRFTCEGP